MQSLGSDANGPQHAEAITDSQPSTSHQNDEDTSQPRLNAAALIAKKQRRFGKVVKHE